MEVNITKEDLRQVGLLLQDKMQQLFLQLNCSGNESIEPQWLKSKAVSKLLDFLPVHSKI